ncbi:MAG: histidinol phosphate phosphatase [Thermoanaerobaculia bacterium]|nr:histidinol phosphate phosphatase [Thermoanaerobaculia bacterium]
MDLAWQAGRITLRHFQVGVEVDAKADGTPVTRADRDAERFLRDAIGARFPDDAVVGEEDEDRPGTSGRTWILDPIDGTKAFVHGVPLYSVLVAVAFAEDPGASHPAPRVGVVHHPGLGETVSAYVNGGCWWNGRRAAVSPTTRLEDALVTTSDFPDHEQPVDLERLYAAARLRRTWGDAYGYSMVATGRADVMIDPIVAPWDVAAVIPIVEEAGGRFSSLDGRPGPWHGHGVATNGLLHDEVLELLPASVCSRPTQPATT